MLTMSALSSGRAVISAALWMTVAGAAGGCPGEKVDRTRVTSKHLLRRLTDLRILRKLVTLPPGDFPCRWTVQGLGIADDWAPGPTDYSRRAYVELDDAAWKLLAPDSLPTGTQPIGLSDEVASWLLPPAVLASAKGPDGKVELVGYSLDEATRKKLSFQVTDAFRVGNGLIVFMETR